MSRCSEQGLSWYLVDCLLMKYVESWVLQLVVIDTCSEKSKKSSSHWKSMTEYECCWFAIEWSLRGTVRPSALAIFRLMTSSILATCTTGKSAGFSPLRILSH